MNTLNSTAIARLKRRSRNFFGRDRRSRNRKFILKRARQDGINQGHEIAEEFGRALAKIN